MTHFGKLRRKKATACGSAITCSTTATTTAVSHRHGSTSASLHCYCLAKLMQKLKKHSKMLCVSRRRDSIQCRYDPLSYSLNFDPTGSGTLPEDHDEDYYRFYAFSSRFVAPPKGNCPTRMLTAASH